MNQNNVITCYLLYVQPHWTFICLRQAFSSFLDPGTRQQLTNILDQEVSRLRQLTFAESTRCLTDWRNKRIYIQSDNVTTVATINRGTSRNPFMMGWLRILFWLSAHCNFHITAHFIKGLSNTVADNISRIHEPKQFHHLLPFICPTPLELHMSQTSLFFFLRSPYQTEGDQRLGSFKTSTTYICGVNSMHLPTGVTSVFIFNLTM